MLLRNMAVTFLAGTLSSSLSVDRSLAAEPGDLISPDHLRAHVEAAADYIAARFKKAGLKPAGTDGFFQPAAMIMVQPETRDFEMAFHAQGVDIKVRLDEVLLFSNDALDLKDAPTVKIDPGDAAAASAIKAEDVKGKVVLIRIIAPADRPERVAAFATGERHSAIPGPDGRASRIP